MNRRVVLLLLLSVVGMGSVRTRNALPRASTEQGIYIGQQHTTTSTTVNYWYGIPYAQQPIDDRRWKPPSALPSASGTHYAFVPNACPQKNTLGVTFSESCLTLNVYSPAGAMNLPVFVWIHGGSFTTGAGIEYDAFPFVNVAVESGQPLLVVTLNYRLGLLGFLADEALFDERSGANNQSTTGNYGVLDQMMALQWIKTNIAGFGGDPTQITVGGESAGGISVMILLTSPLVPQKTFQRVIIESGGLWPNGVDPLDMAINQTGTILRSMTRCSTVECLRHLSLAEIMTVQNYLSSQNIFGVAAGPVLDGYALTETMESAFARGHFQQVPVLVGSTSNETSLFTCPIFKGSATVAQISSFLALLYNATILAELPSIYGPISSFANPLTYLNIVYSDSWAHCGSRRLASRFSARGLPVYLYTYNHLIPVSPSCDGVAHAAELPMLFPSLLPFLFPFYKFSPAEEELSVNITRYWLNFVHASDPNAKGQLTRWDAYDDASDGDLLLDIDSQMRNQFYSSVCSRLWDRYATG